MTEVTITDGKLVVKKEPTTIKGNNKPAKYPYPQNQFDALLKLAKQAGIEASTKASKTKAVNAVTRALIDDFIAKQDKPKTEQV